MENSSKNSTKLIINWQESQEVYTPKPRKCKIKLIIKESTYHGKMVFPVQGIDIYNITCTVRSQTAA